MEYLFKLKDPCLSRLLVYVAIYIHRTLKLVYKNLYHCACIELLIHHDPPLMQSYRSCRCMAKLYLLASLICRFHSGPISGSALSRIVHPKAFKILTNIKNTLCSCLLMCCFHSLCVAFNPWIFGLPTMLFANHCTCTVI